PRAATGRQRLGQTLPLHAVWVRRLRVPPPAHLLFICRGSDRAIRPVGRLLDGAGAPAALSPVRHLRARLRAGDAARGRALVPAVAVRAVARDEFGGARHARRCGRGNRPSLKNREYPLPALVGRSEQERAMVALTFPDGARRDYPNGITGLNVA